MLSKFKGYFSSKSAFQKKLMSSSLLSATDEILLDDLLFLISAFEQGSIDNVTKSTLDEYFKIILEENYQQSYLVRSKYLLTAHLMMHEFQIGLNFAASFLDEKFGYLQTFAQIKEARLATTDHALWVTIHVQLPYYQYLQRLAINIQVFHACKVQQYPFAGDNNKLIDIQTKILWLFKISNMVQNIGINQVNNGLGQMEAIKIALVQYPKELLLKEIVLVYWSDIIVYYNFLSKEILSLIDYYKHLPSAICLQFYELYLQLFQIKNSIGELYKFKVHFDRDNVIKQPKWFDINKPLHKDIEQYMVQQRIEQATSKHKPAYNTDRRVETNPNHRKSKSGNQIFSPQGGTVGGGVRLNLDKVKSYNELNADKKEKIIQTHRPGRKYSYDEEDDEDKDFEMLKQVLQKQNLQQRVTEKKEENQKAQSRNGSNQVSFQKTHQFD